MIVPTRKLSAPPPGAKLPRAGALGTSTSGVTSPKGSRISENRSTRVLELRLRPGRVRTLVNGPADIVAQQSVEQPGEDVFGLPLAGIPNYRARSFVFCWSNSSWVSTPR